MTEEHKTIKCPECGAQIIDTVDLGYHLVYTHGYNWAESENYIKESTKVNIK